jgi:glutaredoxin
MKLNKASGKKRNKKVTLYALSTCGWCRKTKELLNRQKIEYEFCDVDLLTGADRQETMEQVLKVNPKGSYPTIIIGADVVVGFDEPRIAELLKS